MRVDDESQAVSNRRLIDGIAEILVVVVDLDRLYRTFRQVSERCCQTYVDMRISRRQLVPQKAFVAVFQALCVGCFLHAHEVGIVKQNLVGNRRPLLRLRHPERVVGHDSEIVFLRQLRTEVEGAERKQLRNSQHYRRASHPQVASANDRPQDGETQQRNEKNWERQHEQRQVAARTRVGISSIRRGDVDRRHRDIEPERRLHSKGLYALCVYTHHFILLLNSLSSFFSAADSDA